MGKQVKIDANKAKSVVLVGKCGKCKNVFAAEAELPTIFFDDERGNKYKAIAAPHLVVLCPYCFSLLNLAKRTEVNKKREA